MIGGIVMAIGVLLFFGGVIVPLALVAVFALGFLISLLGP